MYNVKKVICGQLLLLLNLMLQEVQFKGHTHKEQGRFFLPNNRKKTSFSKTITRSLRKYLEARSAFDLPGCHLSSPPIWERSRWTKKCGWKQKSFERMGRGRSAAVISLSPFRTVYREGLSAKHKKNRAAITTTMRETCYEKTSRR